MIPANRTIKARVYIGRPDGVTWEDISDFVTRIDITKGNADQPVGQLEMTITNNDPEDYFSPRDKSSKWNQFNGSYAPLLWPNREVIVQSLITEERYLGTADGTKTVFTLGNVEPGSPVTVYLGEPYLWSDLTMTWQNAKITWVTPKSRSVATGYTVDYDNGQIIFDTPPPSPMIVEARATYVYTDFHGLLGDNIQTSGSSVSVSCRDLAKRLQDCYIETVREYGSEAGTPAETVIQQILDDNLGAGEVTLYCPVSPGFMVRPYKVEYQSVWDAIQQVATQIGWFLGYRWDSGIGQFRLTLMEPPRTKDASTADFVLDYEDDFYAQNLDINDADIRNAIKVRYRDAATGELASVTVEDTDSIAEYGRRAMQIENADTKLIDTEQEATDFANAALNDLKDLTATTRLNMPLLPEIDIFSGIVIHDPRVSSTDDFFGVESVRHTLDFEGGRFRTEVIAGGRVIGAHTKWLKMQTRPGAAKPVSGDEISGGIVDVTKTEVVRNGLTKIIYGPDGIIAMDANGDYSQLNGARLAFYKAGSNTPYYYVKRVEGGIANDGETVVFDPPFERPPKVIVSLNSIMTFDPANSNSKQIVSCSAENVLPNGFRVVANTRAPGVTTTIDVPDVWLGGAPNEEKEWISPSTTADATVLKLVMSSKSYETTRPKADIYYRKVGDPDWIFSFQMYTFDCSYKTFLVAEGLEPASYEVRAVWTGLDNSFSGHIEIHEFVYTRDVIISNGTVTWVAIEGTEQ